MSSGTGCGNTPEEVVENVKREFEVSPLGKCSLFKNVHFVVKGTSTFFGRPAIEVASISGGESAIVVVDDWYSLFWNPIPGEVFWVAKISVWGKFGDVVIHFLYHPRFGVGIARLMKRIQAITEDNTKDKKNKIKTKKQKEKTSQKTRN